MIDYVISVNMSFVGPSGSTDEDFGRFINATAAEFEKISNGDLVAGATLTTRTADFTALVPGTSLSDVENRFLVDLRTALHAAGCATPHWPTFVVRDQEVRELQAV